MPMWGYTYGMGGILWILSMLLCLFVFGLMVWGALSLLERHEQHSLTPAQPPSALETLRQRYVRGEIDEPTYQPGLVNYLSRRRKARRGWYAKARRAAARLVAPLRWSSVMVRLRKAARIWGAARVRRRERSSPKVTSRT